MGYSVLLASQSPRRRQLLEQIKIEYQLLLADESENIQQLETIQAAETAVNYVQRVVALKLQAAEQRRLRAIAAKTKFASPLLAQAPILCADTAVCFKDVIIGKPVSRLQAKQILQQLAGQVHQVYTAVGVSRGKVSYIEVVPSNVEFASLTEAEIDNYLTTEEAFDKAGAYAIQGYAGQFIRKIEGSFYAIMGLPLYETVQLLKRINQE